MSRHFAFLLTLFAVWAATAVARGADEELSFKKRGNEEKVFVGRVGEAIVKAAHGTAKKITLVKYEFGQPKAGRTELTLKMEYHGALTDKRYVADITVKIDSSDKNAWEVLRIDYSDNNTIKHNEKKLDELIRQLNK
jgi:hypothetical protein